jgi:undecaprenyl-diphosphatase
MTKETTKAKNLKILFTGFLMLAVFAVWTVLVKSVDVQAIGPENSCVGFAGLNGFVHGLTGVNMALYNATDWLSLIPLCFILGFAFLGLVQLIKRRSLLRVDTSILLLGGFYMAVMAAYIFFELYAVNYRPVLIEGILEVSYPSSTTLLVMTVMPTAVIQLYSRIKTQGVRMAVSVTINAFTAFMVIGRIISGVHWITDIIGGGFLSVGLVLIYYSLTKLVEKQNISE